MSGRYKNWNNLNEKNLLFFIDQATKKNLDVFNQFVYLRKNYGILNFRKAKKLGIFREKFISNFYLDLGFLLGKV